MSSTVILGISIGGFFLLSWIAWKILKSVVKGVLFALVAVSLFYFLVPVAEDRAEIIDGAQEMVEKTKEKAIELAPKAREATENLIEKAKEVSKEAMEEGSPLSPDASEKPSAPIGDEN